MDITAADDGLLDRGKVKLAVRAVGVQDFCAVGEKLRCPAFVCLHVG